MISLSVTIRYMSDREKKTSYVIKIVNVIKLWKKNFKI